VSLLAIFGSLYLLVAMIGMGFTLMEWREKREASLPGVLAGCVLCLAWLPMIVGMGIYQAWRRHVMARRGVSARMSEA
jgi:hypothetical protein